MCDINGVFTKLIVDDMDKSADDTDITIESEESKNTLPVPPELVKSVPNKYMEDLQLKPNDYDVKTWSCGDHTIDIYNKTGMDFRECWEFDMYIALHIYSHLRLYLDYTCTDTEYEEYDFGDFHGTLKAAIWRVCDGLRLYVEEGKEEEAVFLKKCGVYLGRELVDHLDKYTAGSSVLKAALHLFAEIAPSIWD